VRRSRRFKPVGALASAIAGDAWVVTVADRGTGIAAADRGRIFDPLARGALPKTGGEKSTGLGLAIAKAIVDAHGGHLEVESTVGFGTTFTMRIPIPAGGSR
jgi:signal transduction histidine kinase